MTPSAAARPYALPPAEDHRIDMADRVDRIEQVGLPRAGRAATTVDGADGARWGQDDRGSAGPAGAQRHVGVDTFVLPDPNTADGSVIALRSSLVHQPEDQILLQHRQPLIDVEMACHRMVGR